MKRKWQLLSLLACSCFLLIGILPVVEGFLYVKPAFAEVGNIIAQDNFESGNWAGGSGWLDDWQVYGWGGYSKPEIIPLEGPYEGSYHLKLGVKRYAKRAVNLSGRSSLRLQFWAKTSITDGSADCRVSPDGKNWYAIKTWTSSTSYSFIDVDLSSYKMTEAFYVRFMKNDDGIGFLYIDNIEIVQGVLTPVPTTTASVPISETTTTPTSTPTQAPSSPSATTTTSVPNSPTTQSVTQSSTLQAGSSENSGLSGTMIAIIVGICTTTIGGVLASVIYGRMNKRVKKK
ncbi:MAG: hypothetical protein ABR954_07165 [Dehalococcoidales bacterium]